MSPSSNASSGLLAASSDPLGKANGEAGAGARSQTPSESSWIEKDGIFREKRLAESGVFHGVTHRSLGNMKDPQKRQNALRRAGLDGRTLRRLKQVHGAAVLEAAAEPDSVPEADGWILTDPRVVASIYAADCLPIFVWEKTGAAVGVFHAGWRGLAAGMPAAAVRAFRRLGIGAERLSAAIGPHIGACCYEVGPEVASRFHPETLSGSSSGRDRQYLDLGAEAKLQCVEAGLSGESVTVSDACTSCRPDEFFSFRREKMDQRMLAFAALGGR